MAALADEVNGANRQRARAVAQAVLWAMAEPSEQMIAAADGQPCSIDTRALWQCMLRAALHEDEIGGDAPALTSP
jgi:hypothetical protein